MSLSKTFKECFFWVTLYSRKGLYPIKPFPFKSWIVIWNDPSPSVNPITYQDVNFTFSYKCKNRLTLEFKWLKPKNLKKSFFGIK